MKTRHILFLLLILAGCRPAEPGRTIARQLGDFPESRVQDIYKSFCQDFLGPEHMVPDTGYARAYLRQELRTYREDLDSLRYEIPASRYYPAGDKGNYVRLDLSVVLDGLVTEDELLEAFVKSANSGPKATPEEWVAKWNGIACIIRKDFPDIPDETTDLQTLDSLIAEGRLILHHSLPFVEAYHPHYRIIARDIFEKDLKARIDR